jgi:hypothetical protein
MSLYLGDFNPGDTVRFLWNSNSSTGASITRATNGTISVYQNLDTTQSTSGVTDTEDFDSLTGVHAVAIDTSSDGTFYAAGRDFAVVLSGASIDGETVNAVIAQFSLRNRSGNLTHVAGSSVSTSSAQIGVNVVNAGGTAWGAGAITAAAIAANAIDADALAADAVAEINATVDTALADYDAPTRAELTSDINSVLAILQGLVLETGTIGSTGNDSTHLHLTGLTYGDDEINNYLLVIFDVSESEYHARWIEDWANTGDLATVATLPFTPQNATDTYWLLPVRQDVTGGSGLDAAGVRAAVGLASANLDTQLAAIDNAVDTEIGAIISTLGTPAGDSISADIAAIEGKVDDLETRVGTPSDLGSGATIAANLADIEAQTDDIGTAGAGLTAVPWNAAWDAEVQSEVQDAIEVNNLDHLVKSAVDTNFATTVHLDSVIGHLADNGTTATYDRTTDSLEALQAEHDATQSAVDTIDNLLDTEIAAIKADTAAILADTGTDGVIVATNNDKTGYSLSDTGLSTTLLHKIADRVIRRTFASAAASSDGENKSGRSLLGVIARLTNRSAISSSTLTVYEADDTTALYTQTLTTSADADPVVSADTD